MAYLYSNSRGEVSLLLNGKLHPFSSRAVYGNIFGGEPGDMPTTHYQSVQELGVSYSRSLEDSTRLVADQDGVYMVAPSEQHEALELRQIADAWTMNQYGFDPKKIQRVQKDDPVLRYPKGDHIIGQELSMLTLDADKDLSLIWKEEGEGAEHALAFQRINAPEGYFALGDIAQTSYGGSPAPIYVFKPNDPTALKAPVGFELIGQVAGCAAGNNVACWKVIPPEGYVALGDVAEKVGVQPSLEMVRCVRADLVTSGMAGLEIWRSSRASNDKEGYSCWKIKGVSSTGLAVGSFVFTQGQQRPFGMSLHTVNTDHIYTPQSPSKAELEEMIQRYAPLVYYHPEEKYLLSNATCYLSNTILMEKSGENAYPITDKLPTGMEHADCYYLKLINERVRFGDLEKAKVYVHAKAVSDYYTDLQFWYFYAYSGEGQAKLKWMIFDSSIQDEDPSLKPLGAYEGSWKHVTLRVHNETKKLESVYLPMHGAGSWLPVEAFERNQEQIVLYASKGEHIMYASAGIHSSHHTKLSMDFMPDLEISLTNKTAKGAAFDGSKQYELVAANFLKADDQVAEPYWLGFQNRWSKDTFSSIKADYMIEVLKSAFGPLLGTMIPRVKFQQLAEGVMQVFKKKMTLGAQAPKSQSTWYQAE